MKLAKPRKIERVRKKKKKKRKAAAIIADLSEHDQALFAVLRDLRTELAQDQGVPPYMVFGDKTLKQMALEKPDSESQFLDLNGVGDNKLKKYGAIFLEAVAEYQAPPAP